MTTEKNTEKWKDYVGTLVKIMDLRSHTAFYGILRDSDSENFKLFPYLRYEANNDGQFYSYWTTEGKPLRLRINAFSALQPTKMNEIEVIISNNKREGIINAKKLRLEEITAELQLMDMEETYRKLKAKEQ